ncbi:MAG: hypothetical protein MUP70_13820 [Candidatus Aminicenantes bacterium]|nr:hypothetical protein [Candidatus Aminicenantes bacterium]
MADHEILIQVVGGNIVCPRVHVESHETVSWKCDHPFAVDFGWNTPFKNNGKSKSRPDPNAAGKKTTDEERINSDASKVGHPIKYKYTVAVYVASDDPTTDGEILIEDPEVIIDP